MATSKAVLLPKIPVNGIMGFLVWARRDSPALYAGMVKSIPAVALFDRTMREQGEGLGDWTDIFSSIGSAVSGAASSIGSFVASNGNDLLKGALGVYGAVQATKLASTQLQLAQASRPPIQTAYNPATGQIVPVRPTSIGGAPQYDYTTANYPAVRSLTWIPGIPNWVPIATGAGLVAVFFAMRMR